METLRWRSVWSGGLALAWALVAVTAGGGPPSYAAGPGAAIVVNPTGGPPNATVQVQGTGYNPGEQVRLLFDGALWSTAVAGDSGAFVRNAAIPGSAPPGPHQIRAEGLGGSPPSQVNFNVVVVTTTTTSTTTTSTTTTSTTSPSTTTTSPSTTTTSPSTTTTGSTTTTTTTGGSTTTRLPAPGTPAEEPPRPPPPGDQTTTAPTTTQTTQPGAPGTTGPGSTTGPSISGSPGASPRPGTAPVPALVPTVPLVGPTLPPLEPGPAGAPVTRITLAVIAAAGNRASTVPLGQYSSLLATALRLAVATPDAVVASTGFPGASVVLEPQGPEPFSLSRLVVGGGVFLDVAQVRLGGRMAQLPLNLAPGLTQDIEVLLVPAYQVAVDGPEAIGPGIYREGTVARIGVGDTSVDSAGLLGLLAGTSRFVGWDGVDSDRPTLELLVTEPVVARARYRADTGRPAVLMGLVALLLLVCRPVTAPRWDGVELGRKAL